jgi:leucyl-tRNA synthetase
MEYPNENHGTGIVYSSPADSPHDYIYLFEIMFPNKSLLEFINKNIEPLNLKPITKTFDKKGIEIKYKFDIPAYSKLIKHKIYNVKNNEEKLEIAKQEIYKEAHFGAKMINCNSEFDNTPLKNNVAFNKTNEKLNELKLGEKFYETTRRAITRNGDKVIVANLEGQWFLDYSNENVKNKAKELLDNLEYLPKNLKETQKGYVDWANLRPCARKRGLGTKLPFDKNWVIEPLSDSTIYQMLYIIIKKIREHKIPINDLTFDFFENVFFGKN